MKKIVALITAICLLAFDWPAPRPLTFQRKYYNGDRGDLLEGMECALNRIRHATCLDVEISLNGAHTVEWKTPEQMTSSGKVSGSSWGAQRIWLRNDIPEHHRCPVLVHEIVHILRKDYGHPCPEYSMSYPVTSASRSVITQCDLDIICAKYECGCQTPEPTVVP